MMRFMRMTTMTIMMIKVKADPLLSRLAEEGEVLLGSLSDNEDMVTVTNIIIIIIVVIVTIVIVTIIIVTIIIVTIINK